MESDASGLIFGIIFLVISMGCLITWAYQRGELTIKKQAKEYGYMQFKVNQETGESKLEWK